MADIEGAGQKEPTGPTGLIGRDIRIKGEVSGSGGLVIEGEVEGRIDLKDKVTIQPSGVVNADIEASALAIHGKASGNIDAQGAVEVMSTATVVGEIRAQTINIEDGAVIRGQVLMDVPLPEDL